MLKWLIEEFEKSGIYKNFIGNLPYPFNDLYFGLLIIFILACLIIVYVVQGIRSKAMREKIRRRQEEARMRRLEDEEKEKNDKIDKCENNCLYSPEGRKFESCPRNQRS